jgi:hypothetical protein
LKQDAGSKLLEVKASGKLSAEDYKDFEPAVESMIGQAGKIDILFLMHDFHGWDLGGVWEDTKFAGKHFRDIGRIAMVGDKSWEKWMATICKPFTMSKIKYFDSGEADQARQWLTSKE